VEAIILGGGFGLAGAADATAYLGLLPNLFLAGAAGRRSAGRRRRSSLHGATAADAAARDALRPPRFGTPLSKIEELIAIVDSLYAIENTKRIYN